MVGKTRTKGYVYLGGQLVAQYKDGTTYFVHKDHLGSTRMLTKLDKSPLEAPYDYLPYGEPIGSSGSGTTHKFTGKERDAESGLDYFGARYYVGLTGRFQTPDSPFIDQHPVNPQSWNLYAYGRNNPINIVDPTGNASEAIHCSGGGALASCAPYERNDGADAAPTSVTEAGEADDTENIAAARIQDAQIRSGLAFVVAGRFVAQVQAQAQAANQTTTGQDVVVSVCSVEARANIVGIGKDWGNWFTRPIARILMHVFRVKHMSWSVSNSKGQRLAISGGPDPKRPGMLGSWVSTTIKGKVFWRAPQSHGLCSAVDAMLNKGREENWPQNIPYRPAGPNSNSSFNAVGAAGGMPVLTPFLTPGAKTPIP
jgi:RHS repeat-associated protein